MRRSSPAASFAAPVAVALAVLLAGCTGDAGPADGSGSSPESNSRQAADSAASTDMASASGAGGTGAASGPSGTADAASSSVSGVSSSAGGASATGAPPLSTTSVAPSSRPPKPTPSSPEPSGSNAVGALTGAETRWFDALCTGLNDKPSQAFGTLSGDLDSRRKAAAALLTDQADRLDAAVDVMKKAGPPDIRHGSQLDKAVRGAFPQVAEIARKGAKSVAAAGSDGELAELFGKVVQEMTAASDALSAFGEDMSAPALQTQLRTIPSCRQLLGG